MRRSLNLKELLVRVAELYYMEGLTQEAIAQALDLSRPQVSRYLKRARALGIVEIKIMSPLMAANDQRTRLSQLFDLRFVTVVSTLGEDADWVQNRFGIAAAEIVEQLATDDSVVGFGPGRGIYEAVHALTPDAVFNVITIALAGQDDRPEGMHQANQLASEAALHWHARWIAVPAPVSVASAEERDVILRLPAMRAVRDAWSRLGVTLVQGEAADDGCLDVLGYHISPNGGVAREGPRYVIGPDWDALRRSHLVLVWPSPQTLPALTGFLSTGVCRALICSDITAQALIDQGAQVTQVSHHGD